MSFRVYKPNIVNIGKGFLYMLFFSKGASLLQRWGGEGQTIVLLIAVKTAKPHLDASIGNNPNLFQAIRPYFRFTGKKLISFTLETWISHLIYKTKPFYLYFAGLASITNPKSGTFFYSNMPYLIYYTENS